MKRKTINDNSLLAATMSAGFFFFFCCIISSSAEQLPHYVPSYNTAIDCSPDPYYKFQPATFNFRSNPSNKFDMNFSTVPRVHALNPDYSERPTVSACIFREWFTYSFSVSTGSKFIRIYFMLTNYSGFNISKAVFSVRAGRYTLLNTSESTYSKLKDDDSEFTYSELDSGAVYIVREFCIDAEDQILNVTFIPSSKISGSFAFVNKIEIVPMPSKLYIQEATPFPLVGHHSEYWMERYTALEMMHRLNIGGRMISQQEDSEMFRLWTGDENDFMSGEGKTKAAKAEVEIKLSSLTLYAAPVEVYTSATTILDASASNYSAKWSFPVDPGFFYLVRLHFCEISRVVQHEGERVFQVYINNQTAEDHADILQWSHGAGIPIYRDYIVNISGHGDGIKYLSISMRSGKGSSARPILNGLEIFKLSDLSHNLAGPHPFGVKNHQDLNIQYLEDDLAATMFGLPYVLALCIFGTIFLCWFPFLAVKSKLQKKSSRNEKSSDYCRIFSISEIKLATNNFSNTLLIGTGGFGKVYRGSIDSGSQIVAVKRANQSSAQGLKEFQTEIHMLSELRHHHLVSLIGYSAKDQEMILVYDYMAQGTLRDHLYRSKKPPLPWKQRLKICIGAARGMHYLHTGARNTIIHRDIKSTNILLDEKLVAKVSDFGLSKVGPNALGDTDTHVSTIVKGTFGYLDPEYYRRQKLTEKSDVYSFGVVLFESLCARPAVLAMGEMEEEEYEKVNLADWALHCYQMGTLDQIIDPYLNGKIDPECFKTFTDIARKCLAERGRERPSMGDVLSSLELAMQQQHSADSEEDRARKEACTRINGDVFIMIDNSEEKLCFDHSDKTPGVEFSEIMVPVGR